MKAKLLLLGWAIAALLPGPMAWGQEPRLPTKFFTVRPAVNPTAPFWITVNVDKPDRVYVEGEKMTVTVKSEKPCYLYLLYFQDKYAVCLLPNQYEKNNLVPANTEVQIPSGKDSRFLLNTEPPHGKGVLVALATLKEECLWDAGQKPAESAEGLRDLSVEELQAFAKRVQALPKDQWAEFRINIETCATKTARQPKRYAVCIGIGPYPKENGIEPLKVSHLDAQRVADALKKECGVDEVILLVNDKATRAAIERAIFQELAEKAEPGDTVFIYYSGHGWRVADVKVDGKGDEDDGFDEALVPWDAQFGKVETMILDDVFADWLRRFDQCHVAIILDNCYAGGTSKALRQPSKGLGKNIPDNADFIDGELNRMQSFRACAKDLNQPGTIVLAACQAGELAWEMPAQAQGSVFTYHLLQLIGPAANGQQAAQAKAIKAADANKDGSLSMGELHAAVCRSVQDCVEKTFQEKQTPVLLDNDKDQIVIRP